MVDNLDMIVAADLKKLARPHAISEDNICLSFRPVFVFYKISTGNDLLAGCQLDSELVNFIVNDSVLPAVGRKFSFQLQEEFEERRQIYFQAHQDQANLGRRRQNSYDT